MQASDRCSSLRASSSNTITRTTVAIHVLNVRLSSWTEVKESHFGLERTRNRFLKKTEEKPRPMMSEVNLLTANLTCPRGLSILWECKMSLKMVIADWLDRMKTGNDQFHGRYGGRASSQPSVAAFHTILDFLGVEDWKRWVPENFEDWGYRHLVIFQEVTVGALKVTRVKS